jgi:hypothetical protein
MGCRGYTAIRALLSGPARDVPSSKRQGSNLEGGKAGTWEPSEPNGGAPNLSRSQFSASSDATGRYPTPFCDARLELDRTCRID